MSIVDDEELLKKRRCIPLYKERERAKERERTRECERERESKRARDSATLRESKRA